LHTYNISLDITIILNENAFISNFNQHR